jgi:cytochrome b involved in lipid metabolism
MIVVFVTVVLGVAMCIQRPTPTIATTHGVIGIIILCLVTFQASLGLSNLFLKRQPLQKSAPNLANNQPTAIYYGNAQKLEIKNNNTNSKMEEEKDKEQQEVTPAAKKAAHLVLVRTVFILGTQALISTLHTYLGWGVLIAALVNLILGVNLFYTQDQRYVGVLAAWYIVLGLVTLYLQETRVNRWFKCCYHRYVNYRVVIDYDTGNILTQMGAEELVNQTPATPKSTPSRNHSVRSNNKSVNKSRNGQDSVPRISLEDFSAAIKQGRLLVIMQRGVYDIGDFIQMHPGGMHVLQQSIGYDITDYFINGAGASTGHSHIHSPVARDTLSEYLIATLSNTKTGAVKVYIPEEEEQKASPHDVSVEMHTIGDQSNH